MYVPVSFFFNFFSILNQASNVVTILAGKVAQWNPTKVQNLELLSVTKTYHWILSVICVLVISEQNVYMKDNSTPSIPRKRIRGMYPPSGLKVEPDGSSSSCSKQEITIHLLHGTSNRLRKVNQDVRNVYMYAIQSPWRHIHTKLVTFNERTVCW